MEVRMTEEAKLISSQDFGEDGHIEWWTIPGSHLIEQKNSWLSADFFPKYKLFLESLGITVIVKENHED